MLRLKINNVSKMPPSTLFLACLITYAFFNLVQASHPGWIKCPSCRIANFPIGTIKYNATVDDCMQRCLSFQECHCKSIEYSPSNSTCLLHSTPGQDVISGQHATLHEIYQYTCLIAPEICDSCILERAMSLFCSSDSQGEPYGRNAYRYSQKYLAVMNINC